jgi:hypothetical protein
VLTFAIEVHDAPLPSGLREHLSKRFSEPETRIGDAQLRVGEPPLFEMTQEQEPAFLVFLAALAHAQDLAIPVVIDADGDQDRDVVHAVPEAHLHEQPIEVDVGKSRFNGPIAPPLDVLIDALVELADGPGDVVVVLVSLYRCVARSLAPLEEDTIHCPRRVGATRPPGTSR